MRTLRAAVGSLIVVSIVTGCGATDSPSSMITFTRYDGGVGHVYGLQPDGTNERQLTFKAGIQAHSALAPDGSKLVYTQVDPDSASIYSVTSDGGTPQLLNRGSRWSMVPSFSPDGKRVAFTSDADGNYEIYTMAADGSDVRQLTFSDPPIQYVGPKYSPDGKVLLYATTAGEQDPANHQDLWVMPATGGTGTRLTAGLNDRESRGWAPDGKRIVAQTVENGVGQLVVLNADGSALRQITDFPANTPEFSPGGIFPKMRGAVTPAWSPAGDWIAFASNHEGNYDLYLIRPDGSDLTRITDTPTNELSVGWGHLPT